jgi:hypothetical protein
LAADLEILAEVTHSKIGVKNADVFRIIACFRSGVSGNRWRYIVVAFACTRLFPAKVAEAIIHYAICLPESKTSVIRIFQITRKAMDFKQIRRFVNRSGSHLIADLKIGYPRAFSSTHRAMSQWQSFAVIYLLYARQKSQ